MDVKFMKKLIWFGERTMRIHAKDKNLVSIVQAQNVRIQDQLREYLAQHPDKNVDFNPKKDVLYYDRLEKKR